MQLMEAFMNKCEDHLQLREYIRLLERKLGVLNDHEVSCCTITMAQCHAIVEIGRSGNISLVDLANLLNLDNSTMSRTVNNLVNSDYVKRELSPVDRRYVNISLTDKGIQLFNNIENTMEDKFIKIYNSIPEDKRTQVLESLKLLCDAFKIAADLC